MDDFEKELKIGFLDEASQGVADVEQCFLALENDPNNADNLNKIFRLAHNLKGSSKAVGFDEMGAFTHQFESFILRIKNGEISASPKAVNLLLRANDHVMIMIAGLKQDLDAKFDSTELFEEMKNFTEDGADANAPTASEVTAQAEVHTDNSTNAEPEHVETIGIPESKQEEDHSPSIATPEKPQIFSSASTLEKDGIELFEVPTENTSTKPTESSAPVAAAASPASVAQVATPAPVQGAGGSDPKSANKGGKPVVAEESIRVSLAKVEGLINFVGEMVILQSVMREQAIATESLLLKKTVHQLGKVSKEIQDLAMSLRMVPVKPTFQKMQRIVRDTAQALKKDVGITLIGEETELDKTVLEKINDPLVHLIRNSVDHGIEAADLRSQRGKPAKGSVTLSAFHQSGKLVIEVKDDGGGLDAEKLKKKAIEKGILKEGINLTEKDAFNLIFAPGFSTKEQVTDVSGRGVGMDVVRTNIQDLGGEVQIESVLLKGTTFRIILPLTLAIIEGMVITYSNEKFVMPLNHVYETLHPEMESIQHNSGIGDVLLLRGENLPLIRLGDFFGLKNSLTPDQMIAMVIRTGTKPFAILVDDILGQYQVVIKQLGPELQGIKGISGSTILGDGKPALILEPQDMIKRKLGNYYTPASTGAVGGKVA